MTINTNLSGALLIDKPADLTSHDVVNRVRHVAGLRRVGHTGTLDPFATGLLIVALGPATRLIQFTHEFDKEYETKIILGKTSTTDDVTGEITENTQATPPDQKAIQQAIKKFIGTIDQIPPAYAAIKLNGKKLYEYARKGETIVAAPRKITIHAIDIRNYSYPALEIIVRCSTGTYIRALARDLGKELGTGAYIDTLRRTRIGRFDIKNSIKLNDLNEANIDQHIQSPLFLVNHLPHITLDDINVAKFRQGRAIGVQENDSPANRPLAIIHNHQLIGIGTIDANDSLLYPRLNLPFDPSN